MCYFLDGLGCAECRARQPSYCVVVLSEACFLSSEEHIMRYKDSQKSAPQTG